MLAVDYNIMLYFQGKNLIDKDPSFARSLDKIVGHSLYIIHEQPPSHKGG